MARVNWEFHPGVYQHYWHRPYGYQTLHPISRITHTAAMRQNACLVAVAATCTATVLAQPWPQQCTTSTDPWNSTNCPADATCCPSFYSVTKVGCCPFKSAVCCAGSSAGTCCPTGTTCKLASGTGVTEVYNCTTPSGSVARQNVGVCKPGVMLPLSTTLKNVLVIGDSLSIGYLPPLRSQLADIALVQHAPADVSDGGAEETAYGLQCLDYWLHSPSGLDLGAGPDVIVFNFGMHNYRSGAPVPGQEGPPTVYAAELQNFTSQLLAYTNSHPKTKLLYLLTTAQLCSASTDETIKSTLNPAAAAIMVRLQCAKCALSCGGEATLFDPHTHTRARVIRSLFFFFRNTYIIDPHAFTGVFLFFLIYFPRRALPVSPS